MGNLPLPTSLFGTGATTSDHGGGGRFVTRRISKGITLYYAPFPDAADQTERPALHPDSPPCSSPLLPDTLPRTHAPSENTHHRSNSSPASRPLLLFLSWLGAQPAAVAKYTDMYLERGMDVLLVQSGALHFLWPAWGLEYGLEVLKVLEEPQLSGRPVLVYASSIGGYTFTQILTHLIRGSKEHAGLAQRVIGHIYDSLVAGSLEHMAIGLGKTLLPSMERLVKNLAMLYFWLFKRQTADFYDYSVQVFHDNPITAPALFFFCENDALCDPAAIETIVDLWRRRGVAVESRKWKESMHAAHMRCHREEYLSTLERFLNSLQVSPVKARM